MSNEIQNMSCRCELSAEKLCRQLCFRKHARWTIHLVLTVLTVAGYGNCFADVYRCTKQNGKVVYQQQPCDSSSMQKTIDDTQARRRQQIQEDNQRREEEKKRAAVLEEKAEQRLLDRAREGLELCLEQKMECTDSVYRGLVTCVSSYDIQRLLGEPAKIQNVGGTKYLYYVVPLFNGRKFTNAQLQLVVGWCNGNVEARNNGQRIKEVNVY